MPLNDVAKLGFDFFVVGVMGWVGLSFVKEWFKSKNQINPLVEVIQNNTEAMEKLVSLIQDMRVNLAEQGQKIEELLAKARRE